MRRGRLCAAAPPMRTRVRTRAGTRLRGALGVGTAARRGGSVHASEYIYISVRLCYTRIYPYIIHFICIFENRPAFCMRAPVCDGDGSAVGARVGGLVLRARPEPEALNRASPCPSASTACDFGAQAFVGAKFNANIGAWNTASVTSLYNVCAARGPAAHTMADALGRASMRRGRLCAAAPPMRARVHTRAGTRLHARACAHVQALACTRARAHTCRHSLARDLGCRYGRPEGSIHASEYTYICVRVCVTRVYIHTLSIYRYV